MALRAGLSFVGIEKIGKNCEILFQLQLKLWARDVGTSKVKVLRLLCGQTDSGRKAVGAKELEPSTCGGSIACA